MFLFPLALVPGKVQNLRSTLDANIPSLTLNWDRPDNAKAPDVVTVYDIYFRPSGSPKDKERSKTITNTSAVTVDSSCDPDYTQSYIGSDYSHMSSCHSGQFGLQPLETVNENLSLFPLCPALTNIATQSQSGSNPTEGYLKMTMKASTTSVVLTRESGLKPLTTYDFEVRARNANHSGNWSAVSEYIGMCSVYSRIMYLVLYNYIVDIL